MAAATFPLTRVQPAEKRVRVVLAGETIVDTTNALLAVSGPGPMGSTS